MAPFVRELPRREDVHLVVDDRHQPVERVAASPLPFLQDAGDLGGFRSVLHGERVYARQARQ
jgi:hypothetical protein